jgi:hypothetical protein
MVIAIGLLSPEAEKLARLLQDITGKPSGPQWAREEITEINCLYGG